jgi:hypothetical protein
VEDFTARDRFIILDLFVNNEKTLLKVYEALFPPRGNNGNKGSNSGSLERNQGMSSPQKVPTSKISSVERLPQIVPAGVGGFGSNTVGGSLSARRYK